jgi:hypothetical protein
MCLMLCLYIHARVLIHVIVLMFTIISCCLLYNHVYVFIYSLANRKHFYISPLKDSPFKAPPSPSQMTPRSRQLYSFGEGVGVSYNDIYVICILGKTNKKLCFHLPYQL